MKIAILSLTRMMLLFGQISFWYLAQQSVFAIGKNMERDNFNIKTKKKKSKKGDSLSMIPVKTENTSKSPKKHKNKVHAIEEDENEVIQRPPLNNLVKLDNTFSNDVNAAIQEKPKKNRSSKVHNDTTYSSSNDETIKNSTYLQSKIDELNNKDTEIEKNQEYDFLNGWTKDDLRELFKRMEDNIPKKDTSKSDSRVNKLNWEEIKFGTHSANDCCEQWKFIEKRVRRYRLLSELVKDAYSWIDEPWTNFYRSGKNNKHPNMPKRPLSSYMLFYMDKKKKYSKKYPSLEMSRLSKLIAGKYNSLSDQKKEKYNLLAASMREDYNEKYQKFCSDFPELAKKIQKKKTVPTSAKSGPEKPLSPLKMFCQEKLKHLDHVPIQTELSVINHELKEKWKNMSDKKKMPWIRWAHEAELKYLEEIKLYTNENPSFEAPPFKTVLSKPEQHILERMNGKPEKPPNSAYSLYSRLMLKDPSLKMKGLTGKGRLPEIARLWKELPQDERNEYGEKVKHLIEIYKLEYATYLESLSDDKRTEELEKNQPKKRKKSVLIEETPNKKLKQTTIKAFKNFLQEPKISPKKIKSLEEILKLEPVQPPEDAFVLLRDEFIKNGKSEKKANKAWNQLSPTERRNYENKVETMKKEYINEFRTFLTSLKPEELSEYSEYSNRKKEASQQNLHLSSDEDDESEEESSQSSSEDEDDNPDSDES